MLDYHCQFSVPVQITINNTKSNVFSVMDCTSTEPTSTVALIQNASTGAEFYLDKTLNYGEVLILLFLLLFAIFGITKIIADFFIPRRVTKF